MFILPRRNTGIAILDKIRAAANLASHLQQWPAPGVSGESTRSSIFIQNQEVQRSLEWLGCVVEAWAHLCNGPEPEPKLGEGSHRGAEHHSPDLCLFRLLHSEFCGSPFSQKWLSSTAGLWILALGKSLNKILTEKMYHRTKEPGDGRNSSDPVPQPVQNCSLEA